MHYDRRLRPMSGAFQLDFNSFRQGREVFWLKRPIKGGDVGLLNARVRARQSIRKLMIVCEE